MKIIYFTKIKSFLKISNLRKCHIVAFFETSQSKEKNYSLPEVKIQPSDLKCSKDCRFVYTELLLYLL